MSKVVKSVAYVEDKVNNLVEIRGQDEFDKVEVEPAREKTEDEKLLHGPQDDDKALAHAEIDALFD